MLGAEGNKDYTVKTIKYKTLLVAGTNPTFGNIFSSSIIHSSSIKPATLTGWWVFLCLFFRFRPKKCVNFRAGI
ncbi:hypothetical protein [Candidatus Electronema sp. JM]|uniref:hypothetical protein n=1 Tax=Candidatus Electronema sp. JM TaxID=3401571 RepID=UPI003AA8D120